MKEGCTSSNDKMYQSRMETEQSSEGKSLFGWTLVYSEKMSEDYKDE